MRLRAITFDFWSTLVDGAPTPERVAARMAVLHQTIVNAGHACSLEEVAAGFRRALARVNAAQRETLLDAGPAGRWTAIAAELGIPKGMIPLELIERAYDDLTLDPLPEVMPHVHVAVEDMRRAGYRLGVICNTGMAGGRVLREVLRRHGLLDAFATTVFSNEFGYAKPDPRIFAHTLQALGGIAPSNALHVGDMEELDVEGARRAGVFAARYLPEASPDLHTDADLVVSDWREFGAQIHAFDQLLAAGPGLTKSPI